MSAAEPLIGDEIVDVEAAPVPKDEQLKTVAELARRQLDLEKRISESEELLKSLEQQWQAIAYDALPKAMAQVGIPKFSLEGGGEISVKTEYEASIRKDGLDEAGNVVPYTQQALDWLVDNGLDSIIKRQITVLFNRDEHAWARKFMKDLAQRKKPLRSALKEFVEPATLKATVKELIIKGLLEPQDWPLFNVFVRKAAHVKLPKQS